MRIPTSQLHAGSLAWIGPALLCSAGLAFPETGDGTASASLNSPPVLYSLLRVFGALAMVCAIFFGGVWVFRNWQRIVVQKGRPPKLNVLEIRSLGTRHALYVVGYEQQRFLVSSSPAGISLLTPLPEADDDNNTEVVAAAPPNFAEALFRAVGRR